MSPRMDLACVAPPHTLSFNHDGGQPKVMKRRSSFRVFESWSYVLKQVLVERLWTGVFFAITGLLFVVDFIKLRNDPVMFPVMGYCIAVSRGSANSLLFTIASILVLSCRGFLGWIIQGYPKIKSVFPLEDTLPLHRVIGMTTILLTVAHTGGHVCNVYRIANHGNLTDIQTMFKNPSMDHIPTQAELYMTVPAITGLVMCFLIIAAGVVIPLRKRIFLQFWVLHHLFIAMIVVMLFHGTNMLFQRKAYAVCTIPLVLYITDRVWRYFEPKFVLETPVVSASIVGKGDVLNLHLERSFDFVPGSYALVMIPEISRVEWHPFSISSGPSNSSLTFHIQNVGDWTRKLHERFADAIDTDGEPQFPVVRVYGPLGTPSQRWLKYDVVTFVVTGTRITPYLSILSQMVETTSVKNIHLIWATRDEEQLEWVQGLVDKFQQLDGCTFHHDLYITSKKSIDVEQYDKHVHTGRPDWDKVLEKIRTLHQDEYSDQKCGVFAGVAPFLEKQIQQAAKRQSERSFRFRYQSEYL